ncbi:MAG TPA: hypothetical protein VF767_01990 [Bryobacteraceae bacterium]
MRSAILLLAAALALLAGFGMWLAVTPDSLDERAEVFLDSGGHARRAEATALLREALARDPASAYRWCRLGEALQETGRRQAAHYCFRRAAELGPNIPPVLMRAANFHFVAGAARDGLACTRRILSVVRDYDSIVFSTWSRLEVPQAEVLAHGFPPSREARIAYFHYVLGGDSTADAARVWDWLEHDGLTEAAEAARYCEFLLLHRDFDAAAALWSASMGAGSPDYPRPNRVFNGGFESAPGAGPLDWLVTPAEGVTVARDTRMVHGGAYSLRLSFDGRDNLAYRHVGERVVIAPGAYRFRASVRAAELTSGEGIRFRIFDAEAPARLEMATSPVGGTTGWTTLEARLRVRPPTRLLSIEIARKPSLRFDNRISGTAWIDDVELVPDR